MTEPKANRLRLMVVDDEADNLDLLYRTFRRDFEVFRAESGVTALQILAQQGEMAVIISDQRMSRMTGTDFLSRTVEQFPDTIRILLTGYTDVEDLVGAINAGKVFKYITKPWSPSELQTTVMQAAETYQMVKQRTNELHRALRRESIFNRVTSAIRESLDCREILEAVVQSVAQTFAADLGWLWSVEAAGVAQSERLSSEALTYQALTYQALTYQAPDCEPPLPPSLDLLSDLQTGKYLPATDLNPYSQLIVPLTYQQQMLAGLVLYRQEPAWNTEDLSLIMAVAEQAALAISQARLYQQLQTQSEQMRAELAVARQIQTYLLRQSFPVSDQVQIRAYCLPAQEVGGDFFEVYADPQGDIWLAVGDVSGKGVPAALFMASALSLLRRELAPDCPPAPNQVLHNLNNSLYENLVDSNRFITMVLACYRRSDQTLTYANAGHLYPMVWSHEQLDAAPTYLKTRGVPLGILPNWKAEAGQLTLGSGAALLLTSDGITEATLLEPALPKARPETTPEATPSAMLHQSGLWQLIVQQLASSARLDLKALLLKIQAQTHSQEDDQTILSLEVL
jgi:serine phosphatase RsbU (regulator of sigma subunit)/CheY-like chemotaxis protein